jgi:hypothetical protein
MLSQRKRREKTKKLQKESKMCYFERSASAGKEHTRPTGTTTATNERRDTLAADAKKKRHHGMGEQTENTTFQLVSVLVI